MHFNSSSLRCLRPFSSLSKINLTTEIAKILPEAKSAPIIIPTIPKAVSAGRTALITRPAKSAMTSGRSHINAPLGWYVQFENDIGRWENPLMGWTSCRDNLGQLNAGGLRFAKLEDAIRFAQKNGWEYRVVPVEQTKWKAKSYSDNFRYSPGPLRQIPTK